MRLIDAEALVKKIKEQIDILERDLLLDKGSWLSNIRIVWFKKLLMIIENTPTIEAKPIIHAHWDEVTGGRIICSHCGEYPLYDYWGRIKLSRCCHTCGAQMDESISCSHKDDKPFPQTHENGVKIPVISMKDVPKIMEEMEK